VKRRCPLLLAALLSVNAAVLDARDGREHVNVRLYAHDHLHDVTRRTALAAAADIMRGAGVAVVWVECHGAPRQPACASPVEEDRVIRFVSEPRLRASRGTLALGEALVEQGGRGTFATVYVSRVLRLAHTARTDPGVLLGRVVAHELGHLLLGKKAHTGTGLMRGHWSYRDVTSAQPADWSFSPEEVAEIGRTRVMEGRHQSIAGG
jgi:hypothetical protein